MPKIWNDFVGGLKILFNPRYLKTKVEEINRQIDNTSAMNVVGNAQIKELQRFAARYSNDEILHEKIEFISSLPKDDKEDIVDLVNMKKEILAEPEQICKECQNTYIYSCNHE